MARGLLFVLATALLLPLRAAALDAPLLTGYSFASWTERDGVPLGVVRAIVQDRQGYLWLGTSTGLIRFDGVRFSTATALGYPELPETLVRTLVITRDGALWIGFEDSTGVRVIRDGRVERPGVPALTAEVAALLEDGDGAIWAATANGLFHLQGTAWQEHPLGSGAAVTPGALFRDAAGGLWVGTNRGLFKRAASGGFERVGPSTAPVRAITQDAEGRIWVTDPTVGVRAATGSVADSLPREASGIEIFTDRSGNLWVGTAGQGVWRAPRISGDPGLRLETATVSNGLMSNGVWAAFEDVEGNLWLGTQRGINRLTPHSVTPVVDIGVARAVEAALDGVWAGTAGGLLHVAPTGTNTPPRITRFRVPDVVALQHHGGALWVASTGALARVEGHRLVQVPLSPALGEIRSITETADGRFWLADGARGLFRLEGGRLTPFALPERLRSNSIRFIHGDREGRLWIALTQGGLAYVDRESQVVEAGAGQGFGSGTHTTLDVVAEDDHGVVWIGGNGGLTRYQDGRFTTVTRDMGLPGTRITAIVMDGAGHLWLTTEGSVIRMHPDEFVKAAATPGHRIRHTRLDTSNGLGGVPVGSVNERVARTADGHLWFATGWGLTFIDPEAATLHRPASELPALIEAAAVNDARVAADDGVALPARTNAVRIDYTAVNLTSPTRIRFRYRLEGFDAAWVDAGTRRQAFYTNLPPGHYRFVVQAEAGDRSWTNPSDTWTFSIEPAFVQTRAFYVLIALAAVLAAWGTWQLRLRHVRRQFALVLGERARLSREIHDTLLQNLAGVAIQCAGISNSLDAQSPARSHLNSVRREVENYVRDMRQAVWDLRAPVLETHDLAGALREFGAHATTGTGVAFSLAVTGKPRQLAAKVENDVLRVGQEAIRNAIRHARASHIRVELAFVGESLTLRVADDGCGVDVSHQASDERHFGLLGMRERAAQLGGRLHIASAAAGGTDVELVIPAGAHPPRA
jgi:signal transduction histidine kinase/ligand-binding sensor domain-containing protein